MKKKMSSTSVLLCFSRHIYCNLLLLFCTYSDLFLLVKHIIENSTLIVYSKILKSALHHSFVVKHHFTIPHQGQTSTPPSSSPTVESAVSLKSSICIDLSAV